MKEGVCGGRRCVSSLSPASGGATLGRSQQGPPWTGKDLKERETALSVSTAGALLPHPLPPQSNSTRVGYQEPWVFWFFSQKQEQCLSQANWGKEILGTPLEADPRTPRNDLAWWTVIPQSPWTLLYLHGLWGPVGPNRQLRRGISGNGLPHTGCKRWPNLDRSRP